MELLVGGFRWIAHGALGCTPQQKMNSKAQLGLCLAAPLYSPAPVARPLPDRPFCLPSRLRGLAPHASGAQSSALMANLA